LLTLVSLMVIIAVMLLAAVHAEDRYKIDVASGARIALAQSFDQGHLYPELYAEGFYGGTRAMPLPLVLHGWLAGATDEYVVSGKLLSYATMLGLLGVMLLLLRRMRCPPVISLGSVALVLVTNTGLGAAMSLRSDSLPLLLQLGAVAIIPSSRRPWGTFLSALMAALAVTAKLSGVWAAGAVFVWLFVRDKARAARFAGLFLALTGVFLGIFAAASDGRIFENVFGLASSGVDASSIARAPYRLILLGIREATAAWLLLPAAIAGALLTFRSKRPSIYGFSLFGALAVLIGVLTDIGTGWNQLLDVVVLIPLVLGASIRWEERAATTVAPAAMTIAILVGSVGILVPELSRTVPFFGGAESYDPRPLAGFAPDTARVLSEDPYIPVSLGRTPVVRDPYMLLRIGIDHPAAVDALMARIREQEFDLVTLVVPLRPPAKRWWRDYHFGTDVAVAMDESYVFAGRVQGYYVYEPREP
jgi:hypothetical protein